MRYDPYRTLASEDGEDTNDYYLWIDRVNAPIDNPLRSFGENLRMRTDSQMVLRDMGGGIIQVGQVLPLHL